MMASIGFVQIFLKRYGGVAYRQQVIKTLAENFAVEPVNLQARIFAGNRYLKIPESLCYLLRLKGRKDLWIRDFYSTVALQKKNTPGKHAALIFHVDFSGFPLVARLPFILMEKFFFYRQLNKMDAIITISEYWRRHFSGKGYRNVHKIYCGFNVEEFQFSPEEIDAFKKKHNLIGKPIIYIGNCQKAKGALDVYRALRDLDVFLVSSGKRELDIPVLNLDAERREYLLLLKASSVALAMSRFKEGWCMTAHEAMLCKTPVIGSGLGGMRELLEGGRQIICRKDEILDKTAYLLDQEEEARKMGEDGYHFAKEFTMEKFKLAWIRSIQDIINHNGV